MARHSKKSKRLNLKGEQMSALSLCQKIPSNYLYAFYVLYLVLEYILGKTKWGSAIGLLIETPINKVLSYFGINLGSS